MGNPKFFEGARFRVEIAGVPIAYALDAGPFKKTITGIPVPGDVDEEYPGKMKMEDFTVASKATEILALSEYFDSIVEGTTGKGTNDPDLFKDIDFVQLDRDGSDLEIVRVYHAWPNSDELDKFDKGANEHRKETLGFKAKNFKRIPA
jgi:hypothetical protein